MLYMFYIELIEKHFRKFRLNECFYKLKIVGVTVNQLTQDFTPIKGFHHLTNSSN